MNAQGLSPELATAQADSNDLVQFKMRMDGLKKRLTNAPTQEKQLKKACQDFEAVFISKLWQQMRTSVPKEGYLHSKDEEMYLSMFDKEFSEKLSQSGGIGLGNMMFDQLKKKLAAAGKDTLPGQATPALAPVKNLEMFQGNLAMIRAMAEALTRVPPAHLVTIGSDAVFGDEPLPLTEASPKAPDSLHGAMHVVRELVFAEIKAPLAVLRPTLIYGADDPHNGYGPNRFRRLAAEGREIVLFGEGEERRDHVLVDDVSELARRVLFHRSRGSLNCATGQVWSFREVASMVANLYERPVPVQPSPRPGPLPHNGYRPFDPVATRAAFADFRYTSLPEGLARVHAELERRKTG